jgi:hypothetical protein
MAVSVPTAMKRVTTHITGDQHRLTDITIYSRQVRMARGKARVGAFAVHAERLGFPSYIMLLDLGDVMSYVI